MFVGLVITSDAYESVPFRHIPAVVLGLMPSITDWALNQCSPGPVEGDGQCTNTAPGIAGLNAFKYGALLVSMVLAAMFAHICDRKYMAAGCWSAVGAVLSLFGIIHAPYASVQFDNGTPQSQWRFCVGYLMVGVICMIIWAFQKYMKTVEPPVDDPQQNMSVYELVHLAYNQEAPVEELMGGSRQNSFESRVRSVSAAAKDIEASSGSLVVQMAVVESFDTKFSEDLPGQPLSF